MVDINYVVNSKVVFNFDVINVVFKGNMVVMNLLIVINIRFKIDIMVDVSLKNIFILYVVVVSGFWRRFLLFVMILLVR